MQMGVIEAKLKELDDERKELAEYTRLDKTRRCGGAGEGGGGGEETRTVFNVNACSSVRGSCPPTQLPMQPSPPLPSLPSPPCLQVH